jgi:DNA-binding transcriptional LysR family regulator
MKFHTRQLTFRQLEIFRAVAERSSVTEAAQALYLAQPTVST